MCKQFILTVIALSLLATTALADSINNRLGFTGKIGVAIPLRDSSINGTTFETDPGFAGGGGLMYGFGNNFAAELDIIRAIEMDTKIGGVKMASAQMTDVGLGVQYRFMPEKHFVPFVGVGADFIKGDIDKVNLKWTYGGHVNGGFDYFINKGVVLTADFRYIVAEKNNIEKNGVVVGKFDPMTVTGMFGLRLFLAEKWWDK